MFMLDTDTCSYIIRERPISVMEKFQQISAKDLCISVITHAELLYGAARSGSKKVNRSVVIDFTSRLVTREWNVAAAEQYGLLRCALETKGHIIGNMEDMMVAAHALSLHATLVTNNVKHFSKVPHLKIINWV